MPELEIYNSIRQEIISNQVLMHWFTLAVILSLLIGVFIVENRKSVLSVLLPLLSVAWAASILRFDFFIHRQSAYLRHIEPQLQRNGLAVPIWESWKNSLISTRVVLPIADILIFLIIGMITSFLLFGPANEYFRGKGWRGHGLYSTLIILLLVMLLTSLAFVPAIAAWSTNP